MQNVSKTCLKPRVLKKKSPCLKTCLKKRVLNASNLSFYARRTQNVSKTCLKTQSRRAMTCFQHLACGCTLIVIDFRWFQKCCQTCDYFALICIICYFCSIFVARGRSARQFFFAWEADAKRRAGWQTKKIIRQGSLKPGADDIIRQGQNHPPVFYHPPLCPSPRLA